MKPRFPHPCPGWVSPLLLLLALAIPITASGQAVDPGLANLAPGARARLAAAATDAAIAPWQRDVMLGLAGRGDTDPLKTTPAPDGVWLELAPPHVPPRAYHSGVYDPLRERLIVFGGAAIGVFGSGDVWALSLAGTPCWQKLLPSGSPPSGRDHHSAVYDPVRDRMLVFGGLEYGSNRTNQVWALNLSGSPSWVQLSPAGTPPEARSDPGAIYDPVRDRMIVFGGSGESGNLSDVWALALSGTKDWTQLSPLGGPPAARNAHSAIYDPASDGMVVFGGADDAVTFGDAWQLSLAGPTAWTQLSPAGTPPAARHFHGAVYDAIRKRMVVFGGMAGGGGDLDDAWALSLAGSPVWTPVIPLDTSPGARRGHCAIYDAVRERMVVFGGYGSEYLSDTWALPFRGELNWALVQGPFPAARVEHSAVMDQAHERMIVFGGSSPAYSNDAWELSLAGAAQWTKLAPAGTPPAIRQNHSAIYDPTHERMLVFGGATGAGNANDLWELSLSGTPAWTQLAPTGTPPGGRNGHSAIYDPVRNRMVVFGGQGDADFSAEAWALSLAGTPAWTPLTPTGTPPGARYNHSAVYDPVRDRMVVFGGYGSTYYSDAWALSLSGPPAWTQLAPTGTPPAARRNHSAVYDATRDGMLVYGGSPDNGPWLADTWILSLAGTPAWRQISPTGGSPDYRTGHTAVYDSTRDCLVLFGGNGPSNVINEVWALVSYAGAGVDDPGAPRPVSFLRPPAPNPFRSATVLNYSLARAGRVELGVYDLSGRLVRRLVEGERSAGTGTATWLGTDAAGEKVHAGVYLVRLASGGACTTRKVILLP